MGCSRRIKYFIWSISYFICVTIDSRPPLFGPRPLYCMYMLHLLLVNVAFVGWPSSHCAVLPLLWRSTVFDFPFVSAHAYSTSRLHWADFWMAIAHAQCWSRSRYPMPTMFIINSTWFFFFGAGRQWRCERCQRAGKSPQITPRGTHIWCERRVCLRAYHLCVVLGYFRGGGRRRTFSHHSPAYARVFRACVFFSLRKSHDMSARTTASSSSGSCWCLCILLGQFCIDVLTSAYMIPD